jgi:outer membrane receptor protein involved in Fe transport
MKTFNELTTDPMTGDQQQTGETTRKGVELGFAARVAPGLSLWGNYAYTDAHYDFYQTGGMNYNGRRVGMVPRHLGNLELEYRQPGDSGFGARIGLRIEHDMIFYDEPPVMANGAPNLNNDGGLRKPFRGDDITLVDLQFSYRFNEHSRLVLDVNNVFDKVYQGYNYLPARTVPTGDGLTSWRPPRAFFLTYQINYDQK